MSDHQNRSTAARAGKPGDDVFDDACGNQIPALLVDACRSLHLRVEPEGRELAHQVIAYAKVFSRADGMRSLHHGHEFFHSSCRRKIGCRCSVGDGCRWTQPDDCEERDQSDEEKYHRPGCRSDPRTCCRSDQPFVGRVNSCHRYTSTCVLKLMKLSL